MDGETESQTMPTQDTLDSESLLGLDFSFDGTGGCSSLSWLREYVTPTRSGDFLEFDWPSYSAAFPLDEHESDVVALVLQINTV
jgi:hypothetical protein